MGASKLVDSTIYDGVMRKYDNIWGVGLSFFTIAIILGIWHYNMKGPEVGLVMYV